MLVFNTDTGVTAMTGPTYSDSETPESPPKRMLISAKHRPSLVCNNQQSMGKRLTCPTCHRPLIDQGLAIEKQFDENSYLANFMAEDKPNGLEEREVVEIISSSRKSSYKVVLKH